MSQHTMPEPCGDEQLCSCQLPALLQSQAEHPWRQQGTGWIPAHQKGPGTSKGFNPQAGDLPQPQEQSQALLHSAAERGWELLQENGKKGEKELNFTQEMVLVTGSLSPTCSRAQGGWSHPSPFPAVPGMGAGTGRVLLRVTPVSPEGDRSVPRGHAGAGEAVQYLPQPGGRGPRGSLSDGAPED